MGQRANLIIVENREHKVYYSHWLAQETPNILAQGLEFCEKYFTEFSEDKLLLDNASAEGGILIDKDSNKVLIYGGEETSYTPALQRLFCKHIVKIWKEWNVIWCSRGNVDFSEYLGLMEDRILAAGSKPDFPINVPWSYTIDKDRPQDDVITIIENGNIIDYKQDWGLDGINICLVKGEKLKDLIPDALKIETWHNEIETTDSLLVDYDKKKIFVCWGVDTDDRHVDEIRKIWKGWEVHKQTEGLIFHFDYTNRDRSAVEFTEEQFEKYCQDNKLFEFKPK